MKIQNKTLLITGGTGSFGNAVLNRFLQTEHFSEIRIFFCDVKKQDGMEYQLKIDKHKVYLRNVAKFGIV